ncbi:MAG TPA: hypothetical protein VEK13_01040 [Thermoplasmata archaeon]|nr:hypothetical protein [Thermoplasmata archaeon]
MARTVQRRRSTAVRTSSPSPPTAAPTVTMHTVRVDLLEDPHSHIVCRVCGRIQRIELTELDRHLLTELAMRHPDGWSVDGISFSLTGACQRCREGPSVRR